MTIRRGAGSADGGRGSNIVHQRNPGIYRESLTYGSLVKFTLVNGELVAGAAAIDPSGLPVPILHFACDHLCRTRAYSLYASTKYDTDGGDTFDRINPVFREATVAVIDPTAFHATLFTPGKATYLRNEVARGVTVTGAVNVAGYMAIVIPTNRLLSVQGQALTAEIVLQSEFESPLISGKGFVPSDDNGPIAVPCYMHEGTYTQAIFDAGNVFTDSANILREVVGLYADPAVIL